MVTLTEHEIFIFIAALGVIIFSARLFGEIAKKLHQPIIVGEVLAGFVLGPSILGRFFPHLKVELFPPTGTNAYLLEGVSWLCVLFLLLITGLEIDCRASMRHSKRNILPAFFGILIPFAAVMACSHFFPDTIYQSGAKPLHVNLLIATTLSVVAIPVVAKILMDLKILRSNVGLNIITSGVISDILGWAILAVVISLIVQGTVTPLTVLKPIVILVVFFIIALTIGGKLTDRIFLWRGFQLEDTPGLLAFLFSFTLILSAFSHLIGIHAVFGAFIAGLMAGESEKITPHMRETTQDFILGVFAPIFFALIGMKLYVTVDLNWGFILLMLTLSVVLKTAGAFLGGLLSGIGKNNAFALGAGLNSQGTMGIIVALIAKEMGIFSEELFSSLVIVCVLTVLFVGPLLKFAMKGVTRPLAQFFGRDHAFLNVPGKTKEEVIDNMASLMKKRSIIQDVAKVREAIKGREHSMSTAIGEGIALPHARIEKLPEPTFCFFRLREPIDYNSPDNKPVSLLFLELTDTDDRGLHLNLMAQIAKFLSIPGNKERLMECQSEEQVCSILRFDETK